MTYNRLDYQGINNFGPNSGYATLSDLNIFYSMVVLSNKLHKIGTECRDLVQGSRPVANMRLDLGIRSNHWEIVPRCSNPGER